MLTHARARMVLVGAMPGIVNSPLIYQLGATPLFEVAAMFESALAEDSDRLWQKLEQLSTEDRRR